MRANPRWSRPITVSIAKPGVIWPFRTGKKLLTRRVVETNPATPINTQCSIEFGIAQMI